MATYKHSCRAPFGRRRAASGFTLLEVMFTLAILVVAIASTSATTVSMSAFRRANRERTVAHNAAVAMAERIHSVARAAQDLPGAWGRNVVDAICPDGTLGMSFDVIELEPQEALVHVGSVTFLPDETRTDESLGVELGMPRDLNGDGAVDQIDSLPTARLLPVVVEVRWKGIRGDQRIVHPFFLAAY